MSDIIETMTGSLSENRKEKADFLHTRIMANGQLAAQCILEIGRDLREIRDEKLYCEFGCESFGEYCEKKAGFKERQGYNFVYVYEKIGVERLNKLQHLGIAKLLEISKLDDEDITEMAESGEADGLSTKQLKDRVAELLKRTEQLTLDLGEMKTDRNSKASELEELRRELDRTKKELLAAGREQVELSKDYNRQIDELTAKNKELENRPVEVAVQKPTEEEIEAIRAEVREKADAERITAVDSARKAVRDEMQAENDRLNAEIQRLKSIAENQPKPTAPDTSKEKIKFYLGELQGTFNTLLDVIGSVENEEEHSKYLTAAKTVIEKMGGLLNA